MKKSFIAAGVAIALSALAAPSQAQAGTSSGLTRAEVQAELARARAAGEIQPWNDEIIPVRRDATPSTVTRAQVVAELEAARASGELARLQRETYLPENRPSTKTRAQVQAETAEARRLGLMRFNGDDTPQIVTPEQVAQIEAAGLRARGEAVVSTTAPVSAQ